MLNGHVLPKAGPLNFGFAPPKPSNVFHSAQQPRPYTSVILTIFRHNFKAPLSTCVLPSHTQASAMADGGEPGASFDEIIQEGLESFTTTE